MAAGLFITLEGLDGCGKSTQAQLLKEYLSERGYQVILTREPGGTPLAEEIRRVILTPSQEELDPMAEILLYTAARAQHVHQLIKPALAEGKVVICDRFVDSSLAYQGYGLGYDLDAIIAVNQSAIGKFVPDLTFLLDVETEQGTLRVINRSHSSQSNVDRIEARGSVFHERVRRGYHSLAASDSRIILIKSACKTIQEVQAELIGHIMPRLTR